MNVKLLICFFVLLWAGCALVSYKNEFNIPQVKVEQKEALSASYSSGPFTHLVLFSDQTFMFLESDNPEFINDLSPKEKSKIYAKWGDDRFTWGRYELQKDTGLFELYSKINRYGIMKLCRWKGVFPNDSTLKILPGPVNLQPADMMYRTNFDYNGSTFYINNNLKNIDVNSTHAWVNN